MPSVYLWNRGSGSTLRLPGREKDGEKEGPALVLIEFPEEPKPRDLFSAVGRLFVEFWFDLLIMYQYIQLFERTTYPGPCPTMIHGFLHTLFGRHFKMTSEDRLHLVQVKSYPQKAV